MRRCGRGSKRSVWCACCSSGGAARVDMKTFVFLLVLLFAVETWGVVGAWKTESIRYKCTTKVGPLCFVWEQSAIGKVLGDDSSEDIEDAIEKAREAWEEDVVEKLESKGKSGFKEFIEDAAE